MKVTVKDYLNVRVGKPSLNAPTFQYLAPGSEIEIDGQLYQGDPFDGINTWVRDAAGNYYWSDGFEIGTNQLLPILPLTNVRYNYNQQVNLLDSIKATKGRNINVCVMDTGCKRHPALEGNLGRFYDAVTQQEGDFEDDSLTGHGTFVCGLIAASGNSGNEIIGVAPSAKLTVIRITRQDSIDPAHVLNGLKWIIQQSLTPDFLNLSFDIAPPDRQTQAEIVSALKTISDNGTIIFAAAQNDQYLFDDSNIFFPANQKDVVGVGAISKHSLDTFSRPISSKIKFLVPNVSYRSTGKYKNYLDNMSGCSFSTAIVTGVCALIKGSLTNPSSNDIITKACDCAESIKNFENKFKFYKNEILST